jgi:hypothetical protein
MAESYDRAKRGKSKAALPSFERTTTLVAFLR